MCGRLVWFLPDKAALKLTRYLFPRIHLIQFKEAHFYHEHLVHKKCLKNVKEIKMNSIT